MVTIKVLKSYTYRGARIHLEQLDGHTFRYLVVFKNELYAHHFNTDEKREGKNLPPERAGGAALLVSQAAEGCVDLLCKKKSVMYNLLYKYFDTKAVVKEAAIIASEANKIK